MAETEKKAKRARPRAEQAAPPRPSLLPHSELEPPYLLRLFLAYPPQGFKAEYAAIFQQKTGARGAGARGSEALKAEASEAGARGAGEARQSGGLPLFSCPFNLLTALEPPLLKRFKKLPFYGRLARFFTYKTLFAGATVSEFLPLSAPLSADEASQAAAYLLKQTKAYPFVIAKDLPRGANALAGSAGAQAAQVFDKALEAAGFIAVEGQALAFVPVDYADIDAYLARFSKARRKDFRRKLRSAALLEIKILTKGAPEFYDEAALDDYYRLYSHVYAQSDIHFDYLSREFFRALVQEADDSLRFITYRTKSGALIGYNICFIVGDKLVDKYIGLDYPAATEYSLYFVSWFYNLAYAQAQGLAYYVAGWTDRQVKADLGAQFVMTRHRVYIRNPVLRAVLRRLRFLFEDDAACAGKGKTMAERKAQKGRAEKADRQREARRDGD